MAWLGSSGGCAVYYFITSWLVGLSNYLVVCLVCMILVKTSYPFQFVLIFYEQVKRAASVLARLHECKYLLLSLVVITVLPAIPELFIRSTVVSFGQGVCILSTRSDYLKTYPAIFLSQGRNVRLVHPLQAPPPPPPPCRSCTPLPSQAQVLES